MMLDRSSSVPLWEQLLEDLRRRLFQGDWPAGRFPTDQQLVDQYGVSRQTAREAVRRLGEQGLVERQRGRGGTTIRVQELEQPMGTLYSLFRAVEATGAEQTNIVRALDVRRDPVAAARLGLPPDSDLVHIERLRFVEGEPLALDRAWLPDRLAHPLLAVDFTRTAMDEELIRHCGLLTTWARERARAVIPGGEDRDVLGMAPGQPAFDIERLTRAADGQFLEFRRSLMPGDRYSLVAEWAAPGSRG
ncbi:MAG TPA: GntR family transcriptional regulator [Trebonia sp.]|jgi:GntR family transcriptional regulator|nr:GntR family transcriptional regulator [Trebonia sp.]